MKKSKNVQILPEGVAEVCVVTYGSRGHTGAQRHVVPSTGVACVQSLYQEKVKTKTYENGATESRHPLGQSCAQTAHDNCTRMLGLLRASRTTGGSPSLLGQYTPSSRYPKIITLPKDTPRKWRPQSFNSVSQIAEREDLGLFPRQSYSRLG